MDLNFILDDTCLGLAITSGGRLVSSTINGTVPGDGYILSFNGSSFDEVDSVTGTLCCATENNDGNVVFSGNVGLSRALVTDSSYAIYAPLSAYEGVTKGKDAFMAVDDTHIYSSANGTFEDISTYGTYTQASATVLTQAVSLCSGVVWMITNELDGSSVKVYSGSLSTGVVTFTEEYDSAGTDSVWGDGTVYESITYVGNDSLLFSGYTMLPADADGYIVSVSRLVLVTPSGAELIQNQGYSFGVFSIRYKAGYVYAAYELDQKTTGSDSFTSGFAIHKYDNTGNAMLLVDTYRSTDFVLNYFAVDDVGVVYALVLPTDAPSIATGFFQSEFNCDERL